MYLLDLNVLIALSWPRHVHHGRAHDWFSSLGEQPWATTPLTEVGFIRLSSNASVVHRPITTSAALAALREIRALPGHVFWADDTSLASPTTSLSRMVSPKQVTDVHLVNLAARHGAALVTFDRAIPTYVENGERHVLLLT